MKLLLLLLISVPTAVLAKDRKISNSRYYKCNLERGNGGARPPFNKEFIFPYPSGRDEDHVIKGSMRWNSYIIKFNSTGFVEASLTEEIKGKKITASRTYQLGKDLGEEEFKLDLELQDLIKVSYQLKCGPE